MTLSQHAWILANADSRPNPSLEQLNVIDSLQQFRDFSVFQSGVLAFLANLKASSDELDHLSQLFLTLDLNNDGRLTFDEIRSGIDTLSRSSPRFSKAEYLKIMEGVDKDHNKYIDYQEFIAAATDKSKLVNRETLKAAFRTFDRDGSGRITREELRMVFDTMGTRKDQTLWMEIMSEVDKDGDG